MKAVISDEFEEASEPKGRREALLVHQRRQGPGSSLAIFVHGLNGTRYGTWGNFPKFLFEDVTDLDVGVYSYRTGLQRLRFWESIEIEKEALILAHELRELAQGYKNVLLLGHSMGTILIKAAVRERIDKADRSTMERIRALFLFAGPQAGSLWALPVLGRFSKDLRALSPFSETVTDIQSTFDARIVRRAADAGPDQFFLPSWVIASPEDRFVTRFSAVLGTPDYYTKTVTGGHTEFNKPLLKGDGVYDWVLTRIRRDVLGTAPYRSRRPLPSTSSSLLPPKPQPVVGRTDDALNIKRRLGVDRAAGDVTPVQDVTVIFGFTGIGKTVLGAVLCHDPAVEAAFDGILWTTLGENPEPRTKLASWMTALGLKPALNGDPTVQVSELVAALKRHRVLLIVDDVRQPEDVSLFRFGLEDCPVIFLTRNREVADQLAPSSATYLLQPLTPDDALALLRAHVPDVVEKHEQQCRELVADLGGHPMLIWAAARALRTQSELKLPTDRLLKNLSKSSDLLVELAPVDRTDPTTRSRPATGAVLREIVDDATLDYLSKLGLESDRSFNLAFAARVWHVASPLPVVSRLRADGLIEALGDERFEVPFFVATIARLLRDKSDTSGEAARQFHDAGGLMAGRHPHAELELAADEANFGANSGRYEEAIPIYLAALETDPPISDKLRAKILGFLGNAQRNLGYCKDATQTYREAIRLHESAGDGKGESRELVNLALTLSELGDQEQQLHLSKKARSISNAAGDTRGRAKALNSIGVAFALLGHFDRALPAHHEALTILGAEDAPLIESYVREDLAATLMLMERYTDAIEQLEKSLEIARKKQHALLQQTRSTAIAEALLHAGEIERALQVVASARAFDTDPATLKTRAWTAALHGLLLARSGARKEATAKLVDAASGVHQLIKSAPDRYAPWYAMGFVSVGEALLKEEGLLKEEEEALRVAVESYREGIGRCASPGVVLGAARLLRQWTPLDSANRVDAVLHVLDTPSDREPVREVTQSNRV
jgi:tetratricopeptide (TPR) repeat protein/pimeloyl-ACP methyl ester carboxylesterase